MNRLRQTKRLLLFISLFVVVAFIFASAGSAEVAKPTAIPKVTKKVDEAAQIIQSQRYIYVPVDRDIFQSIFLHRTEPSNIRVTKSPTSGTGTQDPTETTPVDKKTALIRAAQQDFDALQKDVDALMKQKKYDQVVQKIDDFGDSHKELGEELGAIMAPISATYAKAQEFVSVVASFKDLCAGIKVLSILRSENHQSAILSNGAFVKKGDIIADLFGSNAPRDFKVIDITPDSIVVGSEELKLSSEIFLDPKDADKKRE